jgi:Fe-S cluster biogenesis protein NfuA
MKNIMRQKLTPPILRQKSQTAIEFRFSMKLIRFRRMNMSETVEQVLNQIRPSLQADGGDVELVGVKDGVVSLRLTGACGCCPMSTMTLKMGIERILKSKLPEVKEVVSV